MALGISIWSLSISYSVKKELNWLNNKQDYVIEGLMFKDFNMDKKNND